MDYRCQLWKGTDNSYIIASHTLRKEFSDASVQIDTPMQVNVSVQTDVCNNTDKFCQTSMKISAMTPRKIQLRKEIKTLEKEGSHAKTSLEVGVTLDDVQKFLDDNYPADSCAFLKSQLSLLNKSPRGSRIIAVTQTGMPHDMSGDSFSLSFSAYKRGELYLKQNDQQFNQN
ncbi:uncharacterized protein LOC126748471 [Anthonomus grandis grandis]|uniref:uncharacterized protein LOC126748471 n=1 Tax=Anthonomus grandis grandis TaxID=2921223 RepID=UPI00216578DE|nr:uncharacterized protein LOC126748471 [Anthonomus grandis grandis]